jgi:D-arabinose 1-dehydrogenase-like Zn-dependent alcohol dehydrogenase
MAADRAGDGPFHIIGERRRVKGSPSGMSIESEDTLRFSALIGVAAMIEAFPLAKAAEAYARMLSGKARFRVVLVP